MTDNSPSKGSKPEELSEDDLGQVTGGAGHEVSHTVQQRPTSKKVLQFDEADALKQAKPGKSGWIHDGGDTKI